MLGSEVFEQFLDESPVCVMARATIEHMFAADIMDHLFSQYAQKQYEQELLFSSVIDLMSLVVCRVHRSPHAAYTHNKESLPVSVKSLYNKLNGIEPNVSRAVVRQTASAASELMDCWPARNEVLPGYRVKVIDGNHLSGTEHRLGELREEAGAALPGVAVALLDPQRGLIEDVVLAEDAYVQEVRLADAVLDQLQPKDVAIIDRQFCTSDILFGLNDQKSFFIVRQHLGHLRWELKGERRYRGRTKTGTVYEQDVELTHPATDRTLRLRRITVELDQPTRNGDSELHLLTNLPRQDADALCVAEQYAGRWTIETAFQQITTVFRCELNTLGHPPAALFSFCLAAACFNVFAVIQAALGSAHGYEKVEEEVSPYYLLDELSGTYRGMMIALPPQHWECFQFQTAAELAEQLHDWAAQVNLSRYQKHRRQPKKTRRKRPYAPKKHVSTARLLKKRKPPSKTK